MKDMEESMTCSLLRDEASSYIYDKCRLKWVKNTPKFDRRIPEQEIVTQIPI